MMLIGVTSLTQVVIKKTHTSFSASCFHPLCKIAFLECSPIVPGLTCAQELALLFPFVALASLSSCLLLNLYELQMSVGKYYCFCQVPRHIKERILHCWVRGYPEVCKMTCTYRIVSLSQCCTLLRLNVEGESILELLPIAPSPASTAPRSFPPTSPSLPSLCLFYLLRFWDRIVCTWGWLQNHDVSEVSLELQLLLPPPH